MSALPQDQNQQRTRAALTSKKFLLHHPSSISMDACVQRRGSSSERERWGLEGGGQALYQCATNGAPGQQSPAGLRGRSCQQLQHALQHGGTQQLTLCCPCCRGQPAVLLETTKADGQPGCRLNCDMYKFTYTHYITHHGALVDSKLVCWPGHEHTRLAKTQKRNARGSAAEGLLQMSTTS